MRKYTLIIFSFIISGCLFPKIERHFSSDEKKQFLFANNLDRPTNLVMTLAMFNEQSIIDVYSALWKINERNKTSIVYRLLIPEALVAVPKPGNVDPTPRNILLRIETQLKSSLGPQALKYWKTHPMNFFTYSWLQDVGEPVWILNSDNTWQIGFLDLNKRLIDRPKGPLPIDEASAGGFMGPGENSDFAMMTLENIFGLKTFRMPNITRQYNPDFMGNQGGNLEILPDGTPYIGDTAPPEMVQFILSTTGKKPVVIPTSFLVVGHVDEIVSFVPSNDACGFSLVVADPLWGQLLRRAEKSFSQVKGDSVLESLRYFAKNPNINLTSEPMKLDNFDLNKPMRKYVKKDGPEFSDFPFMEDWITKKSLLAAAKIQQGVKTLSNHLAQVGKCANLQIIPVPVKTSYSTEQDYFQTDPATADEGFITFSTPTANMIVLGKELIVADFSNTTEVYRNVFKLLTLRQFKSIGIDESRVHFVNASDYHRGMGSIHCGTQVFRRPPIVDGVK